MDPTRFDAITRSLGATHSRRGVLKTLGAATLGAIGLAGVASRAEAAPGGTSACAHFCAAVFGADTPAAGQCTSDAAQGTGLCATCGPAAPPGHPPLCGSLCCPAGQVCQDGTCVTPCAATGGACEQDSDCCAGTCDQSTQTCVSCLASGDQFCIGSGQAQCCPGLICDATTATCVSCIPSGDLFCTSDSDCCAGTCNPISHMCL